MRFFLKNCCQLFFLVLGIAGLYIERYNETKEEFMKKGEELTAIYYDLKVLYYKVKSSSSDLFEKEQYELNDISQRYYSNCLSKQILFSDWFAHYKFFWQNQIDWVDEQKHFKLWRDKLPLSFTVFIVILLLTASGYLICYCIT